MLKLNLVNPQHVMNLISLLLFLKVIMFHEILELKRKKKKILVILRSKAAWGRQSVTILSVLLFPEFTSLLHFSL